ncbi:MAG: phosphate ABC transporter permease PstA [Candidatus Aminicenantes bacterium]|nr:phosphate ABC transporter permease PstA [Candidatus Aminicenantes bacterium]
MRLKTRRILDHSFSGLGFFSIFLLSASLIIVLAPIIIRGLGAFLFKGTVEFRRFNYEAFNRGNKNDIMAEADAVQKYREPVYRMLGDFIKQVDNGEIPNSGQYARDLRELKEQVHRLLGPAPGTEQPVLMRDRYGETRWDMARETLKRILFIEKWDYSDPRAMGKKVLAPRVDEYKGTALEKLFPYLEINFENMMRPRFTFYWRFLTDTSFDSHILGGIFTEVLGTFYLVLGTMLFAIPMGIIAAVYLAEFSRPNSRIVSLLRVFISTLAGVPSIVFGLFGLAFFINTVKVSGSKSVLAGSLTLALLVLPTVIRASEEAIKAVPGTYKEAALSLGAGKLRAVTTVILPAALPGILTGIVISMGRAAGETAPIIFTAAVSVGKPLNLFQTLTQPTPALPWNIYNLVTEHEAVERIRHVQFGMVFTLILLVLLLNLAAIIIRARISKKLRG